MNATTLLLGAGFVVFAVLAVSLLFVWGRPKAPPAAARSGPPPPAPRSHDVLFLMRFEGAEDESYVHGILERHGAMGSAAAVREAALELVRAAPSATHVWLGPRHAAGTLVRCGLPGGVILALEARGRSALDTVADDADLGAVVAQLRGIAAWSDGDFMGGALSEANASIDVEGPTLRAVHPESRPGHQLCVYCDHAFPAHEARCPNCGANASA